MKEVIIIMPFITQGGAERVLSQLISEWVRSGIHITVLITSTGVFNKEYSIPAEVERVEIRAAKVRVFNILRSLYFMMHEVRKRPEATVLVFNKTIMYKLAVIMPFIKNRVVVSERCDPFTDPPKKSRRKLRDRLFKKADACVFQTSYAQSYFSEDVKKKSKVIPNPINPSIPERYQGTRDKTIVAAGRLTEQKNFPMLLDAFADVHRSFPEYKLVIYGRGELENELKSQAKAMGIEDCVSFPGFSDHLYQDMLKCAVYASSSDYEGISNSMLEALTMGLPSVVTDCPAGGARMVIRDHVNGILVPVGDAKAMAEGIREILADEAFAENIGKEASKIRDEYPLEKIAKEWEEMF